MWCRSLWQRRFRGPVDSLRRHAVQATPPRSRWSFRNADHLKGEDRRQLPTLSVVGVNACTSANAAVGTSGKSRPKCTSKPSFADQRPRSDLLPVALPIVRQEVRRASVGSGETAVD